MKDLLCQFAAYNVWAHHKLLFHIQQMDESIWYQQTTSSFDTLHKNVLHLWDAESVWWQRLRLHQKIIVPSATFDPSFKDGCNGLIQQSLQWEPFISEVMNDEALNSPVSYVNLKGEAFTQPAKEILLHVFNHSTHHRGQMVTMLRSMGQTSIPVLDLIAFTRRQS